MAASFVRSHTSGSSTTSGTTVSATTAAAVTSGNVLVLGLVFDNITATTPTGSTVTRDTGETASWSRIASFDSASASSGASVRGEIWAIQTSVGWSSGFSVQATLSSAVSAKVAVLAEFAGVDDTTVGTSGSDADLAAASSATTTGTAPAAGDLVLGLAGIENNLTPTGGGDTVNGSWSTGVALATASGGGTSNVGGRLQWKLITGGGHQTYQKITTTDGGCCIVNLAQTVAVSNDVGIAPRVMNQLGRRPVALQAVTRSSRW